MVDHWTGPKRLNMPEIFDDALHRLPCAMLCIAPCDGRLLPKEPSPDCTVASEWLILIKYGEKVSKS